MRRRARAEHKISHDETKAIRCSSRLCLAWMRWGL